MLRSLAEALEAGQLFSARPAAHQPADADFGVPPAHPAPALRHPSLRDAPGHVANNHGTCLLLRSPPRELQTNPESTSPPLPGAGLGQRAQLPGFTALRCPADGGQNHAWMGSKRSSWTCSVPRRAEAHPGAGQEHIQQLPGCQEGWRQQARRQHRAAPAACPQAARQQTA